MTESGKVHSNFTSIIITSFRETVKHQSLRNCGGCLLLFCVTLWHMSIRTGVVVAVTFQQVDDTPDAETSAQSDNEGLKNGDSLIEKCHKL